MAHGCNEETAMSHIASVNGTLATGLRKRLLRETGEDFEAALDCLFRRVMPRGCQRTGSTHRRVVAFVKHHFRGRLVRERSDGAGRRAVWSCELLLPERPDAPDHGALTLVRVDVRRRAPLWPDFSIVGVQVTQHAVERVLQRRRDGAWDIAALTAELRPALAIALRWQEERLARHAGHWQLPTREGLAFCVADAANDDLHFTTWVRADQLRENQRAARAELLARLATFDVRAPTPSVRVVCGPRTPAAQAQ
jgi:hypothetical protein